LKVRFATVELPACRSAGVSLELVRFNGVSDELLAKVSSRCNNSPMDGTDAIDLAGGIEFDAISGRLLIYLWNRCEGAACSNSGGPIPFYVGTWVAAIEGFATTFEVMQTYTPSAGMFGFRVPYMPEGLPAADHFDTYAGPLTNPIDFTQAQPLACRYPTTPPAVGDYLTVADSLPNPAPGTGRYYVTAVSYQGQRRYGRQRVGGVLSGRDPAVLPACTE